MFDDAQYYEERINRFRVMRREVITDPRRRAEYKINGYDPDDTWSLIWSFENEADALDQAEEERKYYKEPAYIIAVKDAGEATVIKRRIW